MTKWKNSQKKRYFVYSSEATKRVVNTIHYMLNRCPASIISPTSLRAAVDNIHDKLQELHTSKSCIINNSPKLVR